MPIDSVRRLHEQSIAYERTVALLVAATGLYRRSGGDRHRGVYLCVSDVGVISGRLDIAG